MIVIAIIAILAAILIPNFLHARAEARTAACEDNEKQIATALEEYAVDNNGKYPASGWVSNTLLGTVYLGASPLDPASGSRYWLETATGWWGSYGIHDACGHDTTTTKGSSGGPGTGCITYIQNSGLIAQ